MHEGFFFGPAGRQIFASYHPPAGGAGRILTVICPPLFSEYQRTHLALRELALALAQAGQHVLRFDYLGTGDSYGELDQVSATDWIEDVALAVHEAREISASGVLRLLGVRAGALLACSSMGASGDVQRVVLWDPVADGAAYLRALRGEQAAVCARNVHLGHVERREARREYAGYTLSDRMVAQLGSLGADIYSNVPAGILHVVGTAPEAGLPRYGVAWDVAGFRCDWGALSSELIVPRPALERLVQCLTQS